MISRFTCYRASIQNLSTSVPSFKIFWAMFFTQCISQSSISSSCCSFSISTIFGWRCVFAVSLTDFLVTCCRAISSVSTLYCRCLVTDGGAVLRKFRKGEKITDTERKYTGWKNVQVRSFILDKLKASTGT